MKTTYLLSFFFFLPFCFIYGQTPFLESSYEEVEIINNITYGINGTAITLPSLGEITPQELDLDIYLPVNDDESRPLVLILQESSFLPIITNGSITGTRKDSSMVEMCTRLAKYGYAAAVIDYRQGWNPLAPTAEERSFGLINAMYRGIQDGRTAVRFFKKTVAEDGNPYAIDTSRIAVIGIKSAGFVATGMATLNHIDEFLTTTNSPGKFILDIDGDGTPETPMVSEEINGDIEGKNLTIIYGEFPSPDADTVNYPNHIEYSSDIQLAMHISGGIPDISWIDEHSTPIISFHPYEYAEFPYYENPLVAPGPIEPIFNLQGGHFIAERQTELGIFPQICDDIQYPLEEEAQTNSELAEHPYYPSLFPFENFVNSNSYPEGVVIDWWDPNGVNPCTEAATIPWNQLPHWSGTSFHEYELLFNEGMSAEKAKVNIQKIIDFFAPHAHCILDLPLIVNTKELTEQKDIKVFPNPSTDILHISTAGNDKISSIEVFNANGQSVMQKMINKDNNITLENLVLPKGVYFLKIFLEDQTLTKKVILTE